MSEEVFAYQIRSTDIPIEGLLELRRAIAAWDSYRIQRREYMEGDIHTLPRRPEVSVGALTEQYPRAAAYLKAERWHESASFKKSALGKRAMDRIVAGEDHNVVLDDMKRAWDAFRVAQRN